jgi:hypothetical protein
MLYGMLIARTEIITNSFKRPRGKPTNGARTNPEIPNLKEASRMGGKLEIADLAKTQPTPNMNAMNKAVAKSLVVMTISCIDDDLFGRLLLSKPYAR